MKLILLTTKFKTLIISELIDNFSISEFQNDSVMFEYKKEQHICDTYKSKLKYFRTNSNESEIYLANEYFVSNQNIWIYLRKKMYIFSFIMIYLIGFQTYFLFEHIRLLSILNNENILLEKNMKLLLEVANDEMLAKRFHVISDILPHTTKLLILQKITNCISKPEFNLQSCEFLNSKNKDYT